MKIAQEQALAKRIGDVLHTHYPNHAWVVTVEGGLAQVFNFALSGRWGFTLHVDKVTDARVLQAGGEILERYNMRRGAFDAELYQSLQRDIRGDAVGELA